MERDGGFWAALIILDGRTIGSPQASSDAPRGHRGVAQDVRDLTHPKKDRDVSYEILRPSDDGDLAERYEAGQQRARAHLAILVVPSEGVRNVLTGRRPESRPFATSSVLSFTYQ